MAYSPRRGACGAPGPHAHVHGLAGPCTRAWSRSHVVADVGSEAGSKTACRSEPGRDTAINISAYLQKVTQPVSLLKYLFTIG